MKKFELTSNTKIFWGKKLFQIRACISFEDVKEGDLGGYIEKEENLSHDGNAWVCGDAKVCDNAWVCDNAKVYDNAWVCDNAKVCGDAKVCDNAWVCGNAKVCGDAKVCGNAKVYGDADYAAVKGFGSQCRNTTFFRCEDGCVKVVCGCFFGTLDEFRAKVKKTHGENKYSKEYLMIADLMELHFEESDCK